MHVCAYGHVRLLEVWLEGAGEGPDVEEAEEGVCEGVAHRVCQIKVLNYKIKG